MQVYKTVDSISSEIGKIRQQGKSIGFVPTMGALHNGHLSLIAQAKQENDVVVVSVFVNPTQFNDKNDLKNYPRTVEADLKKLEQAGCSIAFVPTEKEIYPEPDTRVFDFGNLNKVMEGKCRKGHFNGVAQVVSRLFSIVSPTRAYFGEKDFQQICVIKSMVKQLGLSVEIVPCPIIRETDGLAMSSRNALLSQDQRKNAVQISQTLFKAREIALNYSVEDLKKWVIAQINANPFLEVEYFEIVDDVELMPIADWTEKKNKVGCIAVKVGAIRLIDNIRFNS
ncbi:MAG: pantoate--beta-alanine ligase [Bacteroidota bacterium]|nr:pantoate--beta-alanine ligase [Bacteroidota bacterium]MDP4225468.1 pantoate--beta-alanine ligase [Bacteroidota bacterium]